MVVIGSVCLCDIEAVYLAYGIQLLRRTRKEIKAHARADRLPVSGNGASRCQLQINRLAKIKKPGGGKYKGNS